MKGILRDLEDSLIPQSSYDDVIKAMKHDDKADQIEAMRILLDNLPKENKETLQFLVSHLAKVATHSEVYKYL